MKVTATLTSTFNAHETAVQTNELTQQLKIAQKPGGQGSAVNGGELLMLAIATCFCNDLYREARKRNITISQIEIEATGDFDAEGESGRNFCYKASVTADATPRQIDELIAHTDTVAEIHNTLRKGVSVTLKA